MEKDEKWLVALSFIILAGLVGSIVSYCWGYNSGYYWRGADEVRYIYWMKGHADETVVKEEYEAYKETMLADGTCLGDRVFDGVRFYCALPEVQAVSHVHRNQDDMERDTLRKCLDIVSRFNGATR